MFKSKSKSILAALLVAVSMSAGALEVGTHVGRNSSIGDNFGGVSVSQKFTDRVGVEATADRTLLTGRSTNRFGVLGTYDVAKLGDLTLTAKAGGAYFSPSNLAGGYAGVAGVGASYPVSKNVSLTADYAYQYGQARVKSLNGNIYTVGLKYSF